MPGTSIEGGTGTIDSSTRVILTLPMVQLSSASPVTSAHDTHWRVGRRRCEMPARGDLPPVIGSDSDGIAVETGASIG